jgi:hypothetical protein
VSVAFHAFNSVLLMLALWMMTGSVWRSAAVALLFVVHPVRVESVAWVAERKDVLSAFFGLLAIIAYVQWVRITSTRRVIAGVALVFLYGMSLLAKPMFVTLPFLLLLLDVWPLQRLRLLPQDSHAGEVSVSPNDHATLLGRLIPRLVEKLPLFGLGLASSLVTFIVQNRVGAVAVLERLSIGDRVGNAMVSYVRYIGKTLWPADLVLQYPHPMSWPAAQVAACSATVIILTVLCVWRFRAARDVDRLDVVPRNTHACDRPGAGGQPIHG